MDCCFRIFNRSVDESGLDDELATYINGTSIGEVIITYLLSSIEDYYYVLLTAILGTAQIEPILAKRVLSM